MDGQYAYSHPSAQADLHFRFANKHLERQSSRMGLTQLALGRAIRARRLALASPSTGKVPMRIQDLADAIGSDVGNVSRIERGAQEPGAILLARIADALGTTPGALFLEADLGTSVADEAQAFAARGRRAVPVLSWVQAGDPTAVTDAYTKADAESWVPVNAKVSRNAYALRVRGASMTNPSGRPSFPDGSTIIVDPEVEAQHNSLAIIRFAGVDEATFKRLVFDGPDRLAVPLNPQFPSRALGAEAAVCGVVVATAEEPV